MKDRWINAGHEEDELKPFVEPELDISDQKRIGEYFPEYDTICTMWEGFISSTTTLYLFAIWKK